MALLNCAEVEDAPDPIVYAQLRFNFIKVLHSILNLNPFTGKYNQSGASILYLYALIVDFLLYKPGAPHPVASALFKALACFCLYPPTNFGEFIRQRFLADKFKLSRAAHGMVVDFLLLYRYLMVLTKHGMYGLNTFRSMKMEYVNGFKHYIRSK